MTGILVDGGSTSTIHGYVLPPDQYNMDTAADPLKFSGYWLASMPDCGLDLKVTKAGTINGSHLSTDTCICDLAGTFSPDSESNFFHVQLNFPQDDCPLHGSATGFALAYTDRSPSLAPIDKILIVVSGADGDSTIITGIQDPSNFSKP